MRKIKIITAFMAAIALICMFVFASCNKHQHVWNEGVIKKAPTCFSTGIMQYSCSECGEKKEEPIEMTAHSFAEGWTSDENGHYHVCTAVNCTAKTEVIPHEWDQGKIIKSPSCIQSGSKSFTCTKCKYTKLEVLKNTGIHNFDNEWTSDENGHFQVCTTEGCTEKSDTLPHNFDNGKITTPPLCITDGVKTFTCTDCGYTKTEKIEKTGVHVFSSEWSYNNSVHYHACTTEGCTAKSDEEKHAYDDGKITKYSTCVENGVKTYSCKCGHTKTESLDLAGHKMGDWELAEGSFVRRCTVCQRTLKQADDTLGVASETKINVEQGDLLGFALIAKNTGIYIISCQTNVEIKFTVYISNRNGVKKVEETLSSSKSSFTFELEAQAVAGLTVYCESQSVEIKILFTFQR